MRITVDPKAKPCPGVDRAIALAEDVLRRGEPLFAAGQLIHNRREVERLEGLGLQLISPETLSDRHRRKRLFGRHFILRAHGESQDILHKAKSCGMKIIDATCPIVRHSHELVEQHAREGWRIVIVGDPGHPEVRGLMARAGEIGTVVSDSGQAEKLDVENRSLLLAQTTVDPNRFAEVRRILSGRTQGLKIVDTVCRYLRNRQTDIQAFAGEQDLVIVVVGKNSSNGRLLYETARGVNKNTLQVEGPEELKASLFKNGAGVGISGGASTPRWQLDEMRMFIENIREINPKGFKNKKGGKFLWWMRKNQNNTE
jgi:4-hydroxy-3-methylbut-2-en-1-yl diphosphate reductase